MDSTRNVITVFAHVYQNISETRTNHVDRSVQEVKNVRETWLVLGTNAVIHVQVFAGITLNAIL